jgi:hypothetical protein
MNTVKEHQKTALDTDLLEHLLLYSTLSKVNERYVQWKNVIVKPITKFTIMEIEHYAINTEHMFTEVTPGDLSRPLDHAYLRFFSNEYDNPNINSRDFFIDHAYNVPLRCLRGLPWNDYPVRQDIWQYEVKTENVMRASFLAYHRPVKAERNYSDGTAKNWRRGLNDNGEDISVFDQWKFLRPAHFQSGAGERMALGGSFDSLYVDPFDPSRTGMLNIHMGAQFSERYDWFVLIGFEDLPKVQIFVNASDVKELFEIKKIIDPIEGRKRLVRFISNYKRKKITVTDNEPFEEWIKVCEHLRGCYEFEWRGLNCWLIPSEYDRERLPKHTKHAEIWQKCDR